VVPTGARLCYGHLSSVWTELIKRMQFQRCPNCFERNDVAVYVHGQLARCVRCGIRFTVERRAGQSGEQTPERVGTELPTEVSMLAPGNPTPNHIRQQPITSSQLFPTPAERVQSPGRQPPAANGATNVGIGDSRPHLPGYDCLQLLGRGGMGEVWKARQLSLDRIVAVKILSPTLAVEPDFVRRFERESSALATLAHPHVVSVYDRGSANGHWYFVMEFVEGRSLRDRVADTRPPRKEIFRLLGQVARAIEYAHKKGVIHRDLKPENVLIDQLGNAKVADFGLAGMSEIGRSSLTMTAVAMGTAHYMAPEQRKDAKNVDGRADLYSLGVMLYELLCAEVPQGRFPSPREKVPDLDRRLDVMIMRLLDQDPDRRPSRAGEVAELLETLADGGQTSDRPIPPPPPRTQSWSAVARDLKSFTTTQKAMLGGAAVAFVVVITIGIIKGGPKQFEQRFSAKIDRTDRPGATGGKLAQVTFGTGAADGVLAIGDGWSLQKNDLVREVRPAEDKRPPRAYLMPVRMDFENASVEADVTMEGLTTVTGEKAGAAELLLYRDRERHVGVRVTPSEESGATLLFTTATKGKITSTAPSPIDKSAMTLRKFHVEVSMQGGTLRAFVDRKPVGQAAITSLSGARAKVAFACRYAKCRFSNVRLSGFVSDSALASVEK
jgi:serine/threonine-protein kinase